MKLELNKNVLQGALTALGKLICRTSPAEAYRSMQIEAKENILHFRTAGPAESIEFRMEAVTEGDFCTVIEYEQFRTAVRNCRNRNLVLDWMDGLLMLDGVLLHAVQCDFPAIPAIPSAGASQEPLPADFTALLNTAAPVVNRNDYRKTIQGINLSRDGITVTNGKELLNIPVPLEVESLTIPFPLALLAAKASGAGKLAYWTTGTEIWFSIRISDWTWIAKAVQGSFPHWRMIMPDRKSLTHSIVLAGDQTEQLKQFLKAVPDNPPNHEIGLAQSKDQDSLIVESIKGMKMEVPAVFTGDWNGFIPMLNRNVLLRLLNEGHNKIEFSDTHAPFLATGGTGQYIAMPLYHTHSEDKEEPEVDKPTTNKENNPMIDTNVPAVSAAVQTFTPNQEPVPSAEPASPLEDLSACIEALKLKLKQTADEANVLSRKVREVALSQKQKDRDFILAKRAIERIRMAI